MLAGVVAYKVKHANAAGRLSLNFKIKVNISMPSIKDTVGDM
jgi:hypothetical protein